MYFFCLRCNKLTTLKPLSALLRLCIVKASSLQKKLFPILCNLPKVANHRRISENETDRVPDLPLQWSAWTLKNIETMHILPLVQVCRIILLNHITFLDNIYYLPNVIHPRVIVKVRSQWRLFPIPKPRHCFASENDYPQTFKFVCRGNHDWQWTNHCILA